MHCKDIFRAELVWKVNKTFDKDGTKGSALFKNLCKNHFQAARNISVQNFSLKSDKRLVRLYADIFLDIINKLVKNELKTNDLQECIE